MMSVFVFSFAQKVDLGKDSVSLEVTIFEDNSVLMDLIQSCFWKRLFGVELLHVPSNWAKQLYLLIQERSFQHMMN